MFLSFVSKTFCPQRFQIMNLILLIPNPLTNILLFTSPLCGVKALGTSTAGTTTALTCLQAVSAHPAILNAVRHALKLPVALYWCDTLARELVNKVSPSPKFHTN